MAIIKLGLLPNNLKTIKTTQTVVITLNSDSELKTLNFDVIVKGASKDASIECLKIDNVKPLEEWEDRTTLKVTTYKDNQGYTNLYKVTATVKNIPKTESTNLLQLDIIPLRKCAVSLFIDRKEINAVLKSSASSSKRFTTFSKRLYLEGNPIFHDTVSHTVTQAPQGILVKQRPTPTPKPPKNWQGFAIMNIIGLSFIIVGIIIANKIKQKINKNKLNLQDNGNQIQSQSIN